MMKLLRCQSWLWLLKKWKFSTIFFIMIPIFWLSVELRQCSIHSTFASFSFTFTSASPDAIQEHLATQNYRKIFSLRRLFTVRPPVWKLCPWYRKLCPIWCIIRTTKIIVTLTVHCIVQLQHIDKLYQNCIMKGLTENGEVLHNNRICKA